MRGVLQQLYNDQRVRFIIGGSSAAALDWLIRIPLGFVTKYWISLVIAQIVSVIYGFFVYRHWAFVGFAERSVLLQVRDYVLVNIAGSVVTVVVALIVQRIIVQFYPPSVAIDSFCHAVGIGVGALANYLGHKHFTFRA